jgi:hypothetical protein
MSRKAGENLILKNAVNYEQIQLATGYYAGKSAEKSKTIVKIFGALLLKRKNWYYPNGFEYSIINKNVKK